MQQLPRQVRDAAAASPQVDAPAFHLRKLRELAPWQPVRRLLPVEKPHGLEKQAPEALQVLLVSSTLPKRFARAADQKPKSTGCAGSRSSRDWPTDPSGLSSTWIP
jgi:hypothetical protein